MADGARVFISCGQRDNEEVALASDVADRLRASGFEPYVAREERSLRALRENLFPRLDDAECFLFIDFRRELLSPGKYRGSLFSHQELAICSYLEKDFLGFQEVGVCREGLLAHLHGNCTVFTDRSDLLNLVMTTVGRDWSPHWQNRLRVDLSDPLYDDVLQNDGTYGRFFQLGVENKHNRRAARNCFGYIKSAVNSDTQQPFPSETVELKWSGYVLPGAMIQPPAA